MNYEEYRMIEEKWIQAIQENAKLKAEIEQLKSELEQCKTNKSCYNCKYFILEQGEYPCNCCENECNWKKARR